MEEALLRKHFNYTLKIWKYIKVKLYFKQATVWEILEFQYIASKADFDLWSWVYNFCKKHLKNKLFLSLLWFYKGFIYNDVLNIFGSLKKTHFKWFFTKWEPTKKWTHRPFSSYLLIIAGEIKKHPNFILDNYTWEQLHWEGWYVDWITRNNNELTDEWKQLNKLKWLKNEVSDEEAKRRVQKFLNSNKD